MKSTLVYGAADAPLFEKISNGDYRVRFNKITLNEEIEVDGFDEENKPKVYIHEVSTTTFQELVFTSKPTKEEIRTEIESYFNNKCNNEILSGLTYNDKSVWLSQENQFNYAIAYFMSFVQVSSGLPFTTPVFKIGDGDHPEYLEFTDFTHLSEFIVLCLTHIQTTLNKYWNIKDSVNWDEYELNDNQ